jgi:hypothetical protein
LLAFTKRILANTMKKLTRVGYLATNATKFVELAERDLQEAVDILVRG